MREKETVLPRRKQYTERNTKKEIIESCKAQQSRTTNNDKGKYKDRYGRV